MPFSRSLVRLGLLAGLSLSWPASAQDAAEIVLRLNRAEGQLRQLSGQIEQLQYENRQLKEQVRKFQEDVEFRFQERGGARPTASGGAPSQAAALPPSIPSGRPAGPGRRGDAFDPSLDPTAPGAPRPLGTTAAPLPPPGQLPARGAPPPAEALAEDDEDEPPGSAPLDIHRLGRLAESGGAAPAPAPTRPPPIAASPSGDPRTDYDAAYAYLLQKQYEQAEMGFRRFIQSHPRDRLVPDATYWLGESYLARSRPREAAEQFLKISTDYSRALKAPDAMLKLGIALQALGARDQACATFAELERKYPQAGPSVRQGVEREQKRARCAA